jgi:aryl-alcohol dehydrogenase-like predicted oxidoreductase
MKKSCIGNSGLIVSQLGLGTVKFGRNQGVKYPEAFTIPEDKKIIALLSYALDLGINLLDTAPAYGISEERLGPLLAKTRKDWVLATKVGEEFSNGESFYNFTPEHARFSIERSLKRLKTDYLDIVLVHSDGNDVHNIKHFGILECLEYIKQQGLIRAFGMSTKTAEGGLLAAEQSDLVMVTYNPTETTELPVIQHAYKNNKGVFIKKALASGHVDKIKAEDPVAASFKFIFQEPGVTSIIVGTLNPVHLHHNVSCVPF